MNGPSPFLPGPRRWLTSMLLAPLCFAFAACAADTGPGALSKGDAEYALQVLERAPEHGFARGSFHVAEAREAFEAGDPESPALLRRAVIAYARAQHGLAIPKGSWPAAWGSRPAEYDAASELDAALSRGGFKEWLDGQAPSSPLYLTLRKAYVAAATDVGASQSAAAATLRANLERLRWSPREEPPTRVDVNIASASLVYVADGQPRLTMRTASGRPGDETPILFSKIDHIVLNPPWNVPQGIAEKELLPKGKAYLASHGYVTNQDGRLVQQPGPGSALGLVKFDFDNPFAVYLHDTPAKAAFARDARAVSHGCVRLERALDLARLLLGGEPGWSEDRISQVLSSGRTTTASLSRPVPVRLMYLTAIPEAGRIVFVPDLYSWDAQVLQRLDRATTRG